MAPSGSEEEMTTKPRRIAYFARELPALSETFVVREIAALRRLAVEVKACSVHPPDPAVIHPELPDLAREAEVLVQPRKLRFWLAHMFFALISPVRYWGCLWRHVLMIKEPWSRSLRALLSFAVAPYAARRCLSLGVAHIHAHFANVATTIAMMAARLAGISFSFTLHSYYETFIDNLLLPEKLAAASFVACPSHFFMNRVRRHYPEAAHTDFHLVRCGIDTESYAPRPHPRSSPPLIVSVGRLVDTKGFPTLLEACALVRDQGIEARWVIIGEGPEETHLRDMVKSLHLARRVTLTGRLLPGEVKSYYEKADMLVLACCVSKTAAEAGNHDCLPYVFIEALAMEIPVIATRIGAIPELVRDGETGLLTVPEDPGAVAGAIIRLLQDQALARRLARAGRDLVVREFNVHQTAQQLKNLFERTLSRRTPPPGV